MKILGAIFALLVTASSAFACPMTLCGAGGNSGPHPLTPPATPDPGSYFNVAGPWGYTNNGLQPNGGTAGAFQLPSTPTNSWAIILEGSVDPTLTYFAGAEYAISKGSGATALGISGNSTGQPAFVVENNQGGGSPNSQWWNAVSAQTVTGTPFAATAGSGYAGGYFPFTMTGSGCARDPSGVWLGNGVANTVDPGFLCPGAPAPTAAAVNIPGDFARQNTNAGSVATTCAANSPVTGNFKVTAQVAVAHGVTPGMTYAMQGFTPSGYNVTYTALPGTTGTTLVGMPATATTGTCPGAVSVEGTAMGGTGGSITMAAISTTNPFGIGMTGVTANNGKHFCAVLGEDGANSNFPGGQFFSALDDRGNALAGAPALVPWLNQGTANFTGYTLVNTQSPSSPALVVTAMNPYPISAATFSSTTGFATFTTSTAPGFIPGSEFTVTGITSSGGGSFNLTYVATNPTGLTPAAYAASTTIWGQPLSGPVGVPATSSLTGASVMTGGASPQMVSVIMPNMMVWGSASSNVGLNAQAIISPYGTFGATGTGGVGTYALINNQPATTTFTATGSAGATSITASGTHLGQPLVPGTAITGTGISTNTFITAYGTGTGGAGTYTISPALSGTLSGSLNVTQTGALWSAAAPGNIFAFAGRFYFNGVGVAGTSNSTVAATSQAALGDFYNLIGATALTIGANKSGWGGSLANVSMLWGAFPQTSGGAPDTTALASLCKKTTDINTFAAANGLTVQSLYRLNDPGIWADSSAWFGQGYITNPGGSSATLNLSSTKYGAMTGSGTVVIAGPGIVGCPTACPTAALGAGPTYALTPNTTAALGSIGSPVAITAGTFKPAKPIATNPFNGYIDAPGGVGTLHVTSVNALATATGTLGGLISNGKIDDGAGGTGTILNVTTISPTPTARYPEIAIGSLLTGDSVAAGTHVTAMYPTGSFTGTGLTGTYGVDTAQNTGATKVIFTSGVLPSAANDLQTNNSSVTGTLGNNMWVTDGGVNITGDPLILTQANTLSTTGFSNWAMNQNYTPAFTNATGLSATQTSLVPGQQVFGAGITTPVSIIALGTLTPCATTGILACGTYILSNAANAPNFTTTPVALNATGIQDGPAVAPGRALTIRDQGAGVPFPTTSISCSALGSCTGTGTVTLSGTFDTSLLGGTPTGIEAQISLSSGGPPVPGCSACAWTALSGYSATLSSGTVYSWKGSAVSIPASGGPLYVSVRAANGTTYATMPSFIKMGLVFDGQGEGQLGALLGSVGTGNLTGTANSYFNGLWGVNAWRSTQHVATTGPITGPAVIGDWSPAFTIPMAGDAFSELQGGVPMPESINVFAQLLTNAFGWPVTFLNTTQDGIGVMLELMGNIVQNQTIDVGNGSKTTFCSAAKFCTNVSAGGPLVFTAATQTGGAVTAKIDNGSGSAGNILTTSDRSMGLLEPGMTITGAGVTGSPTLVSCTSGCGLVTGVSPPACSINTALCYPLVQTWTISGAAQLVASPEPMRGDLGATPWPNFNIQLNSSTGYNFTGSFGTQYIKAGSFQIAVNGTVVCQDNNTFAYNLMGGNCTGAGISSSFVNYVTGDYQVTFSSAPTGPITASWINIITPDDYVNTTDRPVGIDYFGDGTKASGPISSMFDTVPGGVSGHFFGGGQNDIYPLIGGDYATNMSGYSSTISWLYSTKFPSVIPGEAASTPFINMNYWRAQGPLSFATPGQKNAFGRFGQWAEDSVTNSTWTGTIASGTPNGVLTLTAGATGPMWEGEPIGIAGVISGDYIIDLKTGTWGASGSTYDVGNYAGSVAAVASATAMNNSAYYSGLGPAFYAGPLNDTVVQQNGGLNGISGISPHISNGFTGGRRVAARMAAATYGGLTNTGGVWNPPNASDPSLDRVKANAIGCDAAAIAAPCFDVANAFQASHSATITGAAITVTGGIAAHDRPFVVGQAITCSGCTAGRFITSIDVPPSQDSRAGQGEVGQTFHMTANASLLAGPTTETLSAGCAGTSGTGSNCIDVAIQINTTNGTYGTAAALATCGANNLNGASTPPYQVPNGICQTNGVGSLVRSVRIGPAQDMWGATAGSVYDDGIDAEGPSSVGGFFTQNSAFTCNIVAAKVMQCVKGATYTLPSFSVSIGQWSSGNTFIEYSDPVLGTGRLGTLMGSVGGQPLAFTAGSGYTNSGSTPYTITGSCTLGTSGVQPKIDVTVAGGAIVNVYPSAGSSALGLAIGGGCTFSLAALGGGTGGAIGALTVGPFDGAAGIATFNTDSNMMGDLLYDNSGLPGNPLNMFFTNHFGGYFEPGLPVRPWGNYLGVAVSG